MIVQTDADAFLYALMQELPHGSGIDGTWGLAHKSGRIASFTCKYHFMNEVGMYDGWIDFRAILSYNSKERTAKLIGVKSSEKVWLVEGECGDCNGKAQVQCTDCRNGVVYDNYDRPVSCEICEGEGEIKCKNCDEEGLSSYDDLPDLLSHIQEMIGWEVYKA